MEPAPDDRAFATATFKELKSMWGNRIPWRTGLQRPIHFFSRLASKPFWSAAEVPAAAALETAALAIVAEFTALRKKLVSAVALICLHASIPTMKLPALGMHASATTSFFSTLVCRGRGR